MEKEQNPEIEEKINNKTAPSKDSENIENKNESKISSEDKIKELEDKLARTLAEMENQRRRYEKEKDEAFEYGGFTFAKEALSKGAVKLIVNKKIKKIPTQKTLKVKNTLSCLNDLSKQIRCNSNAKIMSPIFITQTLIL